MWQLAVMGAGMAMQAYGQYQADTAQANAEAANAAFYRDQAAFTEASTRRELSLFDRRAAQSFGETLGAFAKGGVDLSGSALSVLAGEQTKFVEERNAIQMEGEFRKRLAILRAEQASDTSRAISDTRMLRLAGTGLTGAAQISAMNNRG